MTFDGRFGAPVGTLTSRTVASGVAMLRLLEQYEHREASPDTLSDEERALEARRAREAVVAEMLLSDPGAAGLIAEKCGYRLSIAKQLAQ